MSKAIEPESGTPSAEERLDAILSSCEAANCNSWCKSCRALVRAAVEKAEKERHEARGEAAQLMLERNAAKAAERHAAAGLREYMKRLDAARVRVREELEGLRREVAAIRQPGVFGSMDVEVFVLGYIDRRLAAIEKEHAAQDV